MLFRMVTLWMAVPNAFWSSSAVVSTYVEIDWLGRSTLYGVLSMMLFCTQTLLFILCLKIHAELPSSKAFHNSTVRSVYDRVKRIHIDQYMNSIL